MGYVLLITFGAVNGWLMWLFLQHPSPIALPAVAVNLVGTAGVLLHVRGWPLIMTIYVAAIVAYIYTKHVDNNPKWDEDDYGLMAIVPVIYAWPVLIVALVAESLSPAIW